MPELPEVARTVLNLNQAMKGEILEDVIVHSGRYAKHGDPAGLGGFREDLPAKIENITFQGKLIIFEFTSYCSGKKWWAWNTLGMGGGWRNDKVKHSHVEFRTKSGSVFFTDIRNFGTLKFTDDIEETDRKKRTIGPNHLNDEIPDSLFKERLMKYPNRTMPEVLMNQSLIGGIGNYIKAEVLYIAGISPHRLVGSLGDDEFSTLNKATLNVIRSSYARRGATISTYKDIDGEEGDFKFYFRVYGRSTCENGFPVVRETTKDKRTTHWVPQLQK
jgi:formamidopyrimidine-DNA glycosylase